MHLKRAANGIWFFRFVLPTTLAKKLQASEIKFTLNTHSKPYAKQLSAQYYARCCILPGLAISSLTQAVQYVKAIPIMTDDLTPITALVPRLDQETLQQAFRLLDANNLGAYVKLPPGSEHLYNAYKRNKDNNPLLVRLDKYPDRVSVSYFENVGQVYAEYIGDNTTIIFHVPYTVHLHQLHFKKLPEALLAKLRTIGTAAAAAVDKAPSSPKLSERFEDFKKFKETEWTSAKTVDEYNSVIRLFIEVIGDKEIFQLTNDDYDTFIREIRQLPINRNTNPKLKGKTLQQIKDMGLPPMSEGTVKKYHNRCVAVFKWIRERSKGKFHVYPTLPKVKEKASATKKKKRMEFSDEHLSIIFESDQSITYLAKQKQAHKVWLPLLALFLGNRLNEAAQLKLFQVHDEAKIPYIEITDEAADQGIKGFASLRSVPIHPKIIEMGFLDYVRYLRTLPDRKTKGQLFPDLKAKEDDGKNFGHQYSQFFGRYMTKMGLPDKRLVFHCFRHTTNMLCRRSGQEPWRIDSYLGWSKGEDDESSEGVHSYMNDIKVEDLVPVMNAIQYPKLNLTRYADLCRATYTPKKYF